eukprot:319920_1
MSRVGFLIKAAAILYIASIVKSRGTSKRPSIGICLIILYILQKVYELGCWKYKSNNPNIKILFYKPFTGSLLWSIKNTQHHFHRKYTKECHRIISETKDKIVIYGYIAVNDYPNFLHHIYDPKMIKYIFEDHFEDYIKGPPVHDTFEELFGDGIFAVDPPEWKFHRKVASRMFSMNNLKTYMFDCAMENTNILIHKMNELAGNNNENVLDMFELFGRYTLQSFIQSAFGAKLPIIESLPNTHPFCSAFDSLVLECQDRMFDVFWKLKRYFKIGHREGRCIPFHTKVLNDFCNEIIDDRNKKQNIMDEYGEKYDLLSLFMKHGGMQNRQLDKKGIRDITMNFVIAARDTTRILLSWFFYEVTQPENEAVLESIYNEIDSHKNDKLIYEDCVPYMGGVNAKSNVKRKYQYLEAVLCEILRLHPPVPFLVRFCNKNGIKIPYKTFDGKDRMLYLNKGDGVEVYTCAYLRMKEFWGTNGRDPNKINVDNFYKYGIHSYDAYTFPVFNLNPRSCLGKTSALLQAKILAISIIRTYYIEPCKNQDVMASVSPILVMKDGFKIRIKPRNQ